MQNRIIFLLLAILFGVALYAEEKNWIDNPGFEGSWNSNDVPEWWSASSDPYITTKETSITHGGNYAVKITGKQSLATLNQSTEHISPIQDEIYELSFYYYMVQSQGSDDIRLNCSWNDANLGAYNTDVLTQSFTATQTGQWEIKTIQTAAPKNAYSFYFEAKIPAGASVIFDDFSFKKIENTGPSMDVNPKTLSKVTTTINTPVVLPKITVTTANLTRPVDVWISGTNSAYFTTEVATIPTTQNTTEIITTYLPTVAGNHTAVLNIDPGVAGLFESIPLSGEATNPTLNPKIEVDRASYTFPDVEVGKSDTVA
ncbi:MAG: hypothetical protein LBG77_01230, partial [Dysgonamonadaceae bacterium]|nr:hypothetical protein [Dysgonamonadaceae bacterium]